MSVSVPSTEQEAWVRWLSNDCCCDHLSRRHLAALVVVVVGPLRCVRVLSRIEDTLTTLLTTAIAPF